MRYFHNRNLTATMTQKLKTTFAAILLCFGISASSFASHYSVDSASRAKTDPVIIHLDSMYNSLFTPDKFFANELELQRCIAMTPDMLPQYTEAEIKAKMKLIPSMVALDYNPQVRTFIDFFGYKRRGLMTRCLANAQIYFPIFEEILDKKGVPTEFKYLPIVESAFNPVAVSKAGATGLWQFMHGTGKYMGLEINSYVDERRDPIKSTEAAADYLNKLYDLYGDWHLVLAAYNSGPGNVNKAIARAGGVKNFWAIMDYLPAETRSYVPTFIAAVYVMEYHKDYKLISAEPKRDLYNMDTVLIGSKVSLQHVATELGMSLDELQFLNPQLRAGIIPCTEKGCPINLPTNYLGLYETKKSSILIDSSLIAPTPEMAVASTATNSTYIDKTVWYKVKKGESLGLIAGKYDVTVTQLRKWNGLKNNTVYPNQKLKIVTTVKTTPVESPQYAGAFTSGSKPATTATPAANTQAADTNGKDVAKVNAECNCVYYTVQPGDTLWNIAEKNGLTIDKIRADNKIAAERPIKVGDILKLAAN
jgi:membrane-bound lytic murein transglycosylase D